MKVGKQKVQAGFTIIELMIVVAIIGILIVIFAPKLFGSKEASTAMMLDSSSTSIAGNISMMATACGTTTAVGSSTIPASGKTMADVVFGGANYVSASSQACYNQAHVIAMSKVAQPDGAGGWQIKGYNVTLTGGGTNTLGIGTVISNVPDEIVLMLAQKYSPQLTALAASDTTSTNVQYGASNNGVRTVTIYNQVQ